MTYTPPVITSDGLALPAYQDIEDQNVASAQSIFGSDSYLAADSQDFQFIAALALIAFQTGQIGELIYNARSPLTAIGSGLDAIVAINGLKRKPLTFSFASATLTGTPFTVITNGIVADINGNQWALPATVTLSAGGTATVTATCVTAGLVTALATQINLIITPTQGWASVTNTNAATPGQPVETDTALRIRQQLSVANPAQGLTTSVLGSILAVPGVVAAQIYENDTAVPQTVINGVTNPGGFPPNSLTLVVSGGDDALITGAYAVRKPPGCYANGDQIQSYIDRFGVPTTIRYYRPTTETIVLVVSLKALTGYSVALGTNAAQAAVDFINGLVAGQNVVLSQVEYAMAALNTNPHAPFFSVRGITACIFGGSPAANDIVMNFNQQAISALVNVTVNAS